MPTWFNNIKRVAFQWAIGCIVAYIFVGYTDISLEIKNIIKLVLVSFGIPCIVLSGTQGLDIIKKVKNGISDTDN